jgi:hypothetical protein
MPVKQRGNACDRVRVSSELHGTFDRYFSSLRKQIIERAAALAAARAGEERDAVMSANDLVLAAQAAFRESTAELNTAFGRREPKHVRRAS